MYFSVVLKEQLQGLMIVIDFILFVQLVIGCDMWLIEFLWLEELCLRLV